MPAAARVGAGVVRDAYGRELAAYPVPALRKDKYWSPVGRADNVYGDRNLVCACPPMEEYQEAAE